jgi:adenylate kinase
VGIFAESRRSESTSNLGRFIVELASRVGVVWEEDQMRKAITVRSS